LKNQVPVPGFLRLPTKAGCTRRGGGWRFGLPPGRRRVHFRCGPRASRRRVAGLRLTSDVGTVLILLHWIGRLVALPLVWIGRAAYLVHKPLAGRLLGLAWRLNGDGTTGQLALACVAAEKRWQDALLTAMQWMDRRPRPQIAAMGGICALQLHQPQLAADLLRRGREAGRDPMCTLEVLEWLIAARDPDLDASARLAAAFEQRHDLSGAVSGFAQGELAWHDLVHGRFDGARRRAERILAIQESLSARCLLWALAERDGDAAASRRMLAHVQAAREAAPGQRTYRLALGLAAIGRLADARQLHAQLAAESPELAVQLGRWLERMEGAGQ
jgi:hypothetical protein